MGFCVELSAIAETSFWSVEATIFYNQSCFYSLFVSIIYDLTDFVASIYINCTIVFSYKLGLFYNE